MKNRIETSNSADTFVPPSKRIRLAHWVNRVKFSSMVRNRFLAILALFAFSCSVLQAAAVNAVVYSVSGSAEYAGPGSANYAPLKKGQILRIGTTVRTGDNGSAVLVTTPGSAIQVGNSSVIRLNALAFARAGSTITQRQAVVQLTTGIVSALIDPSTPNITDFRIQTPQGAAAARGTFYAVLVYNGKTYVGVKEGKVAASASK
jgi:hypothetical protein